VSETLRDVVWRSGPTISMVATIWATPPATWLVYAPQVQTNL
jgi:hypothetical protein